MTDKMRTWRLAFMIGRGGKYLELYAGIAVDGEEPWEVPDGLHSLPSV